MTTADHGTPPAASAAPLRRTFLVADGPDMDAELACQAGEGGLRESDMVVILVGVEPGSVPIEDDEASTARDSETEAEVSQ